MARANGVKPSRLVKEKIGTTMPRGGHQPRLARFYKPSKEAYVPGAARNGTQN